MTQTESKKYIWVNEAEASDGAADSTLIIKDLDLDLPEGKRLLDHFNLTLNKGDRLILTGKSGCGKSTFVKAVRDLWDYGEGEITLPSGATVMAVSQKAYFPNTTLRGILNAPQREGHFDDDKLAESLEAVEHENLIQHIPGAQVKKTMDRILEKLPHYLDDYENRRCTPQECTKMKNFLGNMAENITREDFDFVQYVPESQKEYFRSRFDDIQKCILSKPLSAENVDDLTDHMLVKMDQALANILMDKIADKAYSSVKSHASASVSKLGYFMGNLQRSLGKNLGRYMANKDTDDLTREIKFNHYQADFIKERLAERIEERLWTEHCKQGGLRSLFNALTWPLSVLYQPLRAKRAAKDVMQDVGVFMGTQTVTGNRFATRLSGGEQQRLMFARVLLHKPDILVLDEITAALDEDSADTLYQNMIDKLPETIMISVSHDKHIIKYHTHHAELDPEKQKISVKKLQP